MKIVIVMSVWNRQILFNQTLRSIANTSINDVELVVVDDASDPSLDVPTDFRFRIHTLRTQSAEKFWQSAAVVPFNRGMQVAISLQADIVVLQSPECLHIGDVLADVLRTSRKGLYLTYGCFSADKELTQRAIRSEVDWDWIVTNPDNKRATCSNGPNGWFNHSKYRPADLEFLAAVHRSDLLSLNGYDERFADGVACGDCDLLRRVKNLGLEVRIIDNPFVVHLWHYDGPNPYDDIPRFRRNENMLRRLESQEPTNYRALRLFTEDFK